MRLLMHTKWPHEKFNAAVRDGTAGAKVQRILDETKPETVYFTNYDGQRGAILIINVDDPSEIPSYAEPWFVTFDADVQVHIVMSPEELGRAGLEELGKKWS